MSIPALQALRARYPAAHIGILAAPWVTGLYSRETFHDELIPYEAPRGWRGLDQKWNLARQLRRRRYDCAILLQNAFEAAALVRTAGIPERIGFSRDGRGFLLTRAVPVPRPGEIPRHQRFYYLELLRRAGLISSYSESDSIRLSGALAAAEGGRKRFRRAGLSRAVIGVSPGAAYGGAKRWLTGRFAEAAVQLARDCDADLALFGSAQEFAICQSVYEQIEAAGQHAINFAGTTSLSEFIELAAACDIFLTNDSGPMHIASALGVRTVAIFGATDDQATGPTGKASRVVREAVECSPCLLRECPIDHRCMTGVNADRVVQAALSLVAIDTRG